MSDESTQIFVIFLGYILGVLVLGVFAHKLLARGNFVKGYFLGHRGLGSWVLALTMAATAVSGGSFTGFPALIYSNGWVMALWISSYMVVSLTLMLFLGKRINQASRVSGSVTVPDVLRDRFRSPTLGLAATVTILFFATFNLVAQFKAGGLVMKEAIGLPVGFVSLPGLGWEVERGYLIGLVVFAATVIGYTAYGGFWAVTWNDVLQGIVMLAGVLILAGLALRAVPPTESGDTGLSAATHHLMQQDEALVYGPGPNMFLPVALAFSFFLMWSLNGPGQPGYMVRLMAFKDGTSFRRGMVLLCLYYMVTYMALIVIFICARAIYPDEYLKGGDPARQPDSIMPVMARTMSGSPLLAGVLLAAPYAAIMSTVAAYLLMISSSLVRDVYQRSINPDVSDRTVKVMSYTTTAVVGLIVMIGALNPPTFLQYIIVFTGSGWGCAFLVPMAFALYWRRATKWGVLCGMIAGGGTVVGLYALGWVDNFTREEPSYWVRGLLGWLPDFGRFRSERFAPLTPAGLDPLVWGYSASLLTCWLVSRAGRPDQAMVEKYFPPRDAVR